MLLIKNNQLKIQATVKYNRQKIHLIRQDTFGCKWQKTNTGYLKKNKNLLAHTTEVPQEKVLVGPYRYSQNLFTFIF